MQVHFQFQTVKSMEARGTGAGGGGGLENRVAGVGVALFRRLEQATAPRGQRAVGACVSVVGEFYRGKTQV